LLLYQRTVVAPSETMTIPFVDNPSWARASGPAGLQRCPYWAGISGYPLAPASLLRLFLPGDRAVSRHAARLPGGSDRGCGGIARRGPAMEKPHLRAFLMLAFVAILPAANLLFPIGTIMAERLLYLPCVGVIFASWRWHTAVWADGPYLLGVLLATLAVRTFARNADWKSNLTLSAAAVDAQSRSYKAISC